MRPRIGDACTHRTGGWHGVVERITKRSPRLVGWNYYVRWLDRAGVPHTWCWHNELTFTRAQEAHPR